MSGQGCECSRVAGGVCAGEWVCEHCKACMRGQDHAISSARLLVMK